jgi:ketosteroid isomerase-like protein
VTDTSPDHDERGSPRAQIVWRLCNEGWLRADFDVVFELVDPEIVWTAMEDAPDAGTYRGHDEVRGYMQDLLDAFDGESVLIEEWTAVGDRLVCVLRARGTGKGSGVGGEFSYACVYRFGDDDRIVEVNEYATGDEALAAAAAHPASETDEPPRGPSLGSRAGR